MNWSSVVASSRLGFQKLLAIVTPKRAAITVLVVTLLGTGAIVAEALVRAELDIPSSRMPSALYTRAVPWSPHGRAAPRRPTPIATLKGVAPEFRIPVGLRELPDHLVDAVLAVEDQRYFRHDGLDFRRIAGAMVANVRASDIVEGGSTITQQLAKNLFLSSERTSLRKLREAAISVVLELRYDKWTILEAYLNEIYLGQDGGQAIHGVGAAAQYYFGKDVRKLNLAESALLAGMIHAPNRHAPSRHPDSARQRRNLVLNRMADQERITLAEAQRATRSRVPTRTYSTPTIDSRHFRDFAQSTLPAGVPARGMAFYSTLDASLQRSADRAIKRGLSEINVRGVEAALVAIDPRTGEVLAMVGGRDYASSQFNRATDALRQPGSAFKPIVALAALEREEGEPAFTLASVVDDAPLRVSTPDGDWEPNNYDRSFRGAVTVRYAMEQSLNVPFARIGMSVGPARIVATARRLGIISDLEAVPSLALGSSEVTLLEMVRAYGVIAAGGRLAETRVLLGAGPPAGEVTRIGNVSSTEVVDPAVAYLVTSSLEGVIERGTGRALGRVGRGLAGKTGTSNNWRDAWFLVYSPEIVVGVWVGHDDGRSIKLTGSAAALPIVSRFLADASLDLQDSDFDRPDGLTDGYVVLGADGSWVPQCGNHEIFLVGTEPNGYHCDSEPMLEWDGSRGWGAELRRRAGQFLDDLLARRIERGDTER